MLTLRPLLLAAVLAGLVLPAPAAAKSFWGLTTGGSPVNMRVLDATNRVYDIGISWKMRCPGAKELSAGTTIFLPGKGSPFTAVSNDHGTPIGPFVRGTARATGRRHPVPGKPWKERWTGTFRLDLEVFDGDRKIGDCKRRERWQAWREGYGRGTWRMTSDPGDWIGDGRPWSFDSRTTSMAAQGDRSQIRVGVGNVDGPNFLAYFEAPKGGRLRAGRTYANAERMTARDGYPGMDVSGNHRACNTLRGSFTIRRARFDKRGRLLDLTLDFEQHCDSGEPALRGSIVWRGRR